MGNTSYLRRALLAGAVLALAGCASAPERVREIKRLEGQVTARGVGIGEHLTRSWGEEIESNVAAATLIYRPSEGGQNIDGLTISANGTYMVFPLVSEIAVPKRKTESADPQEKKEAASGVKRISNLRALRFAGAGTMQITTGPVVDLFPSFGPGNTITFASDRIRPRTMGLFRISAERPGGVAVIQQPAEAQLFAPSVANDGTMVYGYFPTYPGAQGSQVWALGGSLIYPMQLREGRDPAISPSGEEVAFIGKDGQLWIMSVTGVNPVQITFSDNPVDHKGIRLPKRNPHWSPDGNYLVYASADGQDAETIHNYDIWIIPKAGGSAKQLTTNGSMDVFPRVSPSGNGIYFVSNRGFRDGIWSIPYPADLADAQVADTWKEPPVSNPQPPVEGSQSAVAPTPAPAPAPAPDPVADTPDSTATPAAGAGAGDVDQNQNPVTEAAAATASPSTELPPEPPPEQSPASAQP